MEYNVSTQHWDIIRYYIIKHKKETKIKSMEYHMYLSMLKINFDYKEE